MVDSIGATPLQASGSIARIAAAATASVAQPAVQKSATAATAAPPAPASPAPASPAVVTQLGGLAKSLAAAPPVDADRVSAIKKAIANGSFPMLPTTVADRLLALRLNWNGHDAA